MTWKATGSHGSRRIPALKARVFPWELMTQIKPQGSGGNRVPRKAHGEEECVAVRGKFSMSRA